MKDLNFSFNWNNKLQNRAFTTLRLSDKYNVGDELTVNLKKEKLEGTYYILDKKVLLLENINKYIAYLDTGYNPSECKLILQRMYKSKNVDWSKQKIYFYLIVKE